MIEEPHPAHRPGRAGRRPARAARRREPARRHRAGARPGAVRDNGSRADAGLHPGRAADRIARVAAVDASAWHRRARCCSSLPARAWRGCPGGCWRCRNRGRARRNWFAPARTPSPPAARQAARIPWQLADINEHTDGHRLMELVDVLMAVPPNIVHAPRAPAGWDSRQGGPPLLVLDPRVPGQRPDSALGSVLGRPSPQTPLAQHFAELMTRRPVLPAVDGAVELFRRQDADRAWLAKLLAQDPSRLMYVGHASSADIDARRQPGRPRGDPPGLYGRHPRRRRRDRRSPPADRIGPDVVAVADAAAGGPAGLRVGRRLSIRRGHRPGGGDDPRRRTAGDRDLVVTAHHGGLSQIRAAATTPPTRWPRWSSPSTAPTRTPTRGAR